MVFNVIISALTPWDLAVESFGMLATFIMGHFIEEPPTGHSTRYYGR